MYRNDKLAKYQSEVTIVDYIHDYGLDPEKREIYLFGREEVGYGQGEAVNEPGVEYMMANQFIKNLRILQNMGGEPILVHMKTNGGFVTEGMAIYNAILACHAPVAILNYTHARSMSSIIFQAADLRAMMPDSTFMFHDGTIAFEGTIRQFHTEAAQEKLGHRRMMDIYLDQAEHGPAHAEMSRKQIENWMRREMDRREEVYLDAEETVRRGFADMVFGANGYDWTRLRKF